MEEEVRHIEFEGLELHKLEREEHSLVVVPETINNINYQREVRMENVQCMWLHWATGDLSLKSFSGHMRKDNNVDKELRDKRGWE